MTYIQEHMTAALRCHILERKSDTHFVMRRPETGTYLLHVAEVGNHIVLTGDLTIGGPHGCVSAGGYGLNWFSGRKSEEYLCEKFLTHKWQWEAAAEELRNWVEGDAAWLAKEEDREPLRRILDWDQGSGFHWDYDVPTAHELYEALREIEPCYVDDGVPGKDYPRADAGWLCAAQQKFAELFAKSFPLEPLSH